MIKLNLLSEQRKFEIRRSAKLINLINNLAFLTLIIALSTALTLVGQQYLGHTAKIIDEVVVYTALDKDIAAANQTIDELELIQKDYVKWSRVLFEFVDNIPEGNKINRVNFNKKDQKLVLNGFAQKRDDFLKLEEALKGIEYICEIKSPISNLLKQNNISFSLEAKLNL